MKDQGYLLYYFILQMSKINLKLLNIQKIYNSEGPDFHNTYIS